MSTRRIVLIIAVIVALPVLGVGVVGGYLWVSGTPLIDEWECVDGEAPYVYPDGGSACAKEGSELPPGATWDPFGNRPFECHDRWGWTEVVRSDAAGDGYDCVKKGEPIPAGWEPVE